MLLQPNKKSTKRLREVLSQLYIHLDNSALQSAHDVSKTIIILLLKLNFVWLFTFNRMSRFPVWFSVNRNIIRMFTTK